MRRGGTETLAVSRAGRPDVERTRSDPVPRARPGVDGCPGVRVSGLDEAALVSRDGGWRSKPVMSRGGSAAASVAAKTPLVRAMELRHGRSSGTGVVPGFAVADAVWSCWLD